jgi:hypothetical protein
LPFEAIVRSDPAPVAFNNPNSIRLRTADLTIPEWLPPQARSSPGAPIPSDETDADHPGGAATD